MIDALITGRLVNCKEHDVLVTGRIVMDGDKPIQFSARRGVVKAALMALPAGMPIAVSGQLACGVRHDKEGRPYVLYEIFVTAVMTAQQPKGLMAATF